MSIRYFPLRRHAPRSPLDDSPLLTTVLGGLILVACALALLVAVRAMLCGSAMHDSWAALLGWQHQGMSWFGK